MTDTNDDDDKAGTVAAATSTANDADEQVECNETTTAVAAARILCQQARSLWLEATCPEDLKKVENLYCQVWANQNVDDDDDEKQNPKKRRLSPATTTTTITTAMSCTSLRQQAGERLAMLLLQSGRTQQADDILKQLPFIKCRLSKQILAYHNTIQKFHADEKKKKKTNKTLHKTNNDNDNIPCRIYDNFLSMSELEFLQNVFQDPSSSYWTSHNYAVEPPSPYFSHIIPLDNSLEKNFGCLGIIIRRIQTILTTTEQHQIEEEHEEGSGHSTKTRVTKPFAPMVQRCTHVEMWAHNRPHVTGHQLHFDSDNEGHGDRIRHPVVSCILYLSSSTCDTSNTTTGNTTIDTSSSSSSAPSLITNQRRVSHRAADKAWLIEPKLRRLAVFDGRVLHGVLPGQGVLSSSSSATTITTPTPARRVTLMLAFWRHIQIRSTEESQLSSSLSSSCVDQAATAGAITSTPRKRGGAAQPFPMNPKDDCTSKDCAFNSSSWAGQLRQPLPPPPCSKNDSNCRNFSNSGSSKPKLADPIPLDHVYETLDSQPWTHKLGMPEYNEVFQGF